MLKDITIGQYFPGKSLVHRMDPRMKIILVILYIVMLFTGDNVGSLIVGIFFLLIAYPVSKIPMKMVVKGVKPVIPIILFTAVLNMLFVDGKCCGAGGCSSSPRRASSWR